MNFVNTLHTKKELEEEYLEIFNQWWFTQGKNLITKTIKYVVCSDCVDMLYNINAYAWYLEFYNSNKQATIISQALFLKFIRSKLWNMGLNLLVDNYCQPYIRLKGKDKYSDCFVFFLHNKIESLNILIELSQFSDLPCSKVEKIFNDAEQKVLAENPLLTGHNIKDFNNVEQKDISSKKISKPRKKKSKKNVEKKDEEPVSNDFTFTSTASQDKTDAIVTLHNNYDDNVSHHPIDVDECL